MLQPKSFMETDFILYGAGGHAKVINDCIFENGYKTRAVFDDNKEIISLMDIPVLHRYESTLFMDCRMIISVGNNIIRKKLVRKTEHSFGIVTHPGAYISKSSCIEDGTVIFQNAVVQPSVIIGHHCIINTSSVIEHDCTISDFVHISPNATICGGVNIGEGSHIGAASVIIPGIKIGKWVTVGAGSVIIRDVPDHATIVGNPGRIIKITENEI